MLPRSFALSTDLYELTMAAAYSAPEFFRYLARYRYKTPAPSLSAPVRSSETSPESRVLA
jgi:hypothetical protein